jgi:hypothetical protein
MEVKDLMEKKGILERELALMVEQKLNAFSKETGIDCWIEFSFIDVTQLHGPVKKIIGGATIKLIL